MYPARQETIKRSNGHGLEVDFDTNSPKVLVVDDQEDMCRMLADSLDARGYDVDWRMSASEALSSLESVDYDALVTDLNMDDMNGLELCQRSMGLRPDLPVILITAFGSMDSAVGAIRAGAYDYITKPFEAEDLGRVLRRAVRQRRLEREVKRLRRVIADAQGLDEMIGESTAIRKVYRLVRRVADTNTTVLITGESGTGKELVARALHQQSERREHPFVAVNCAAMPATLLESELFGHVKGAFTDARTSKTGLLVEASGGTLFLDEISEMAPEMQAKLLRALQERKVRPVGATTETSFDARIIAATNRDLEAEVEAGRFREDLYYRINVVHIPVPPLRSRDNDVLLLAQHFIEKSSTASGKNVRGLSSEAAEKILAYDWPGNVRELQNCIERAVALTQYEELVVEDLPEKIRNYQSHAFLISSNDPEELLSMEEIERRYIHKVLAATGGNKTAAAKILGFDRRTLYRKLERYEKKKRKNA